MIEARPRDAFHAIADEKRRAMIDLLSRREHSVQELLPHFDITLGAVSQHLKVLLNSGLVIRRKEGRYRFYRANPVALREVYEWTALYSRFWDSRLDRLGDYMESTDEI